MVRPKHMPRRRNRTIGVAEALGGVLDPVLKKRGFASRDIIAHWPSIAPAPYGDVSRPDRLSWPRGERRAEGATLFLCCAPGHALAITHDAPTIAAAVNRYFGYLVVNTVRLSANAFSVGSGEGTDNRIEPSTETRADVAHLVSAIEDDGLREALRQLGHGVLERNPRRT